MEKNKKEKQMLYEWGVDNKFKDIFLQTDDMRKSYFLHRKDSIYIREYAFETIQEITKELDVLWEDDEKLEKIKKVIGVAAIKNKPVRVEEAKGQRKVREEGLTSYIYNF